MNKVLKDIGLSYSFYNQTSLMSSNKTESTFKKNLLKFLIALVLSPISHRKIGDSYLNIARSKITISTDSITGKASEI